MTKITLALLTIEHSDQYSLTASHYNIEIMNKWIKNSMKNLLALSEEKSDFSIALKEWTYTGNILDHQKANETCELCEHEDLRYHYEITNELANVLWVGSKCIDKFDIKIYDNDGIEITSNKEAYLLRQAKIKHQKKAFDDLIKLKTKEKMHGYSKLDLDEYCKQLYITQNDQHARILNYVFLRLDEENIPYEKRFFSIKIRSQFEKEKLLSLNSIQFERIRAALKRNQVEYYLDNKSNNNYNS